MQRILNIALVGITMALPISAMADKGNNWRAEYEAMSQKEKDAFNKTRADIKSKVNQMSNKEREAFKKQIESQHGSAAGETIYIEAIPQGGDVQAAEVTHADAEHEESGWKALSFEEKRRIFFEDEQ